MESWVWSSDWGLASIDAHCLQMMAYAKFSGAPINFHESGNPFWTPKSNLPIFRHGKIEFTSFPMVVSHLKEMNYSADYNLTPKQQAEVIALSQYLEERLYPALLYVFWLDKNNHSQMTRPWFVKHMPFPFAMYYPKIYRDHAINVIESRFGIKFDENDLATVSTIESAVFKNAEECLNMVSERLGSTNTYLFGMAPSSADAILYGYLAPLIKAPFPNPSLQNHVKANDNLWKFVSHINLTYFAKVASDYQRKNAEADQENSSNSKTGNGSAGGTGYATADPNDPPINKTNMVLASSVAISAMTAYAFHSGLVDIVKNIKVELVDEYDEEEDVDETDD